MGLFPFKGSFPLVGQVASAFLAYYPLFMVGNRAALWCFSPTHQRGKRGEATADHHAAWAGAPQFTDFVKLKPSNNKYIHHNLSSKFFQESGEKVTGDYDLTNWNIRARQKSGGLVLLYW